MKLSAAEFAPDQSALSGFIDSLLNALPYSQNSYGPVGTLGEVGNALTLQCKGAWSGRGTDGTVVNFAFDANDAYLWNGTSFNVVTQSATTYSCAPEDMWNVVQFGNEALAFNGTDDMQTWTIGTSTLFDVRTATSGTAPVCKYGAVIRDFFVTANISGAKNRVQWPDINSTQAWNAGQASSQDLPVGGPITGIVGGEYGTIFCETAIWTQTTMRWRRALWGVQFKGSIEDDKPMLLGDLWHDTVRRGREFYEAEPTRALLFQTRAAARRWCKAQMLKYQGRNDCCAIWRYRPVRVVETVKPL